MATFGEDIDPDGTTFLMVINPNGVWGTIPLAAALAKAGPPATETWREYNRELTSGGQIRRDYELLEDDAKDYRDRERDQRRRMSLIAPVPDEQWQEVSRETENVLIEDPNSNAELEYRRVTKITYEMTSDGVISYPAGSRPRRTITLDPPDV